MLAKRVIACLDVRDGRTVKGRRFDDLKEMGDPAELAARYERQGADEIVLLDITATAERRYAMAATVKKVARRLRISLSVGGGIRSPADAQQLFANGADKVCLNTAAVENPALVRQLADAFGSQSVVVAIDAKRKNGRWSVRTRAGKKDAGLDAVSWAAQAQSLGAGEILLTSIERDGTNTGFDVALLEAVSRAVSVPVIASGGAGSLNDFFRAAKVSDAVLAAGVFHRDELSVGQVKQYLKQNGVNVRT